MEIGILPEPPVERLKSCDESVFPRKYKISKADTDSQINLPKAVSLVRCNAYNRRSNWGRIV
jgi:hypothetical protein